MQKNVIIAKALKDKKAVATSSWTAFVKKSIW